MFSRGTGDISVRNSVGQASCRPWIQAPPNAFDSKFRMQPAPDDMLYALENNPLWSKYTSREAEGSSFNRQPQAYSLSLFRVRLRLTVKRGL